MRSQNFFAVTALLFAVGLAPLTSARASTVLEDSTKVMQGAQSFGDSFTVSTPGTLTVSVASIPWLDGISDFQFSLAAATGLVKPSMGAGTHSFDISPGTYYGMLFGDANGKYKLGLFNLEITFQPQSAVVPLPSSLVLMLSGLGILARQWRRRQIPL
jgi:hypothetical protein